MDTITLEKIIGKSKCTPLERSWAIKNTIASIIMNHEKAREIGALMCDFIMPYMVNDKMKDIYDDDCSEYWEKCKLYLLTGR